ncbi:hypothetical protein AVEN_260280-1 [Araneus ventricosus]|uniref:Uncharacterized protein n=1 Tax=Araneus ventricosus TaxID=182803 RepID=A0A4Y2QIL2_ARAVE|nr:hypothetical protein AVEN_260280-1 [Araneus ventricosus]
MLRPFWRLGDKCCDHFGDLATKLVTSGILLKDFELSTYFYWFHELSRDYVISYVMKSLPVEKYKRQALKPRRVSWNLICKQAGELTRNLSALC